jgi:hypothetical protein
LSIGLRPVGLGLTTFELAGSPLASAVLIIPIWLRGRRGDLSQRQGAAHQGEPAEDQSTSNSGDRLAN